MLNETLSATSLLVSLIQGDNSFGFIMDAIQTINVQCLTFNDEGLIACMCFISSPLQGAPLSYK